MHEKQRNAFSPLRDTFLAPRPRDPSKICSCFSFLLAAWRPPEATPREDTLQARNQLFSSRHSKIEAALRPAPFSSVILDGNEAGAVTLLALATLAGGDRTP